MEYYALIGLLVAAGLIWSAVAPIYLIVTVNKLKRRLASLEAKLTVAAPATPTIGRKPVQPNPWAPGAQAKTAPKSEKTLTPVTPAQEDFKRNPAPEPPERYVVTAENQSRLGEWLAQNWVSVVAVLSLTFAGIFFVRYGIEHGLLPPTFRVICGLALGAALIIAGERARLVGGSGPGTFGQYLPGTLCTGGIASIYSAILGARVLYDLIGIEVTFAGLVAAAALAVVLGLRHGSYLTIMGVFCAVLAPFVIGGKADDAQPLFYYFALIGGVALATDSYQRTAWVSTLGLAAVYLAAIMLHLKLPGSELHFLAFASLTGAAALTIPMRSLKPAFAGGMTFFHIHHLGPNQRAEFPTLLAMGGICGLIAIAVLVAGQSAPAFWFALAALALVLIVLTVWLRTTVLDDAVPLVLAAMLGVIALNGIWNLDVAATFRTAEVVGEENGPKTMLWLVLYGMAVTSLLGLKGATAARFSTEWAFCAAGFAPGEIATLALWWEPEAQLSDVTWAFHVTAVAVLLCVLAQQALKNDRIRRLRPSIYALAAFAMIAFALSIVLTETALTLAFATVVFAASWLDRRHDLPLLSYLVQVGVIACGYRLLLDPGVIWAQHGPLREVVFAFGGVILLLFATLQCLKKRDRTAAIVTAESAAWSLPGILICILVFRMMGEDDNGTHWAQSIYAMIWAISGAVQAYRAQIHNALRTVRLFLAILFSGVGTALLVIALTVGNPLLKDVVLGPPIADSLLIAYGLPVLLIAVNLRLVPMLHRQVRIAGIALGTLSLACWIGLEIRRLWRGPDLTVPGTIDGELYTYTVVLMVTGAGMLMRSIQTGSTMLRRVAMSVIGLTIAKVFLIDMGGLDGLIRVFAFLALGLTLAGLAWLDAVIGRQRQQ